MQGKRHVLLALEIPGKPDHFTVLRPSTGPAVKPMKLDELNSRSTLSGWLAQLARGEGLGCCMHVQLCKGRCAGARPGWSTPWPAARCTSGIVQRLGDICACSVTFCLAWTHSNLCQVTDQAVPTVRKGPQTSALLPWAVHKTAQLSGYMIRIPCFQLLCC